MSRSSNKAHCDVTAALAKKQANLSLVVRRYAGRCRFVAYHCGRLPPVFHSHYGANAAQPRHRGSEAACFKGRVKNYLSNAPPTFLRKRYTRFGGQLMVHQSNLWMLTPRDCLLYPEALNFPIWVWYPLKLHGVFRKLHHVQKKKLFYGGTGATRGNPKFPPKMDFAKNNTKWTLLGQWERQRILIGRLKKWQIAVHWNEAGFILRRGTFVWFQRDV